MGIKKIYFHIFVLNQELYLNSISGGVNAIKTWIEYINKDKYKCYVRSNLDFNIKEFLKSDLIIICNARAYLPEIQKLCLSCNKPFATIPFFEEQKLYWPCAKQFMLAIANIITQKSPQDKIQKLNIGQFQKPPFKTIENHYSNKPVYENALFNLTNATKEAKSLKTFAPKSTVEIIQLSCGIVKNQYYPPNHEFLKKTGLKKGEYIIQVGRIDSRKNHIASVISSRNHKAPLVFIFSQYMKINLELLILTINAFRRDKQTIFVTNKSIDVNQPHIQVVKLKQPMTDEFIISAYQNAALNLHPAFYELPGYTYLEAAKLAIPSVASSWGSIKDYFTDKNGNYTLDKRISYSLPYDIHTLEKRIIEQFGQSYPIISHPTFNRTNKQMSKEMEQLLDKYL